MDKAKIYEPGKERQGFTVQFNPNSLEYMIYSNEKKKKGTKSKESDSAANEPHFQRDPTGYTDRAVLSVHLFYHTYYNSTTYTDVRDEIKKLRKFVRYSGNTTKETIKMAFAWGSLIHIGELNSLSVSYRMFASDGTPVQAEVSLSIVGDEADRATEQANQLSGTKAKLNALYDSNLEDPLQTMWAWLYF